MGKLRKAFTIVELLIVIALFSILGTIISYVIIKSLKSASTSSASLKTSTSVELNTDILDFDIRHVGYGISKTETSLVLSYCNGGGSGEACSVANYLHPFGNKLLLLKETSEVTDSCYGNNPTIGFAICNGTLDVYSEIKRISNYYGAIIVDLQKNLNKVSNIPSSSCSEFHCSLLTPQADTNKLSIIFPYRKKKACQGSNAGCCKNQPCTAIAWYAKTPRTTSSFPQACRLMGTQIFYRHVIDGNEKRFKRWSRLVYPAINCVSDWNVWFGLNLDNDTEIDRWVNRMPTGSINNNTALAKSLKVIKVYLFVQASYTPDKAFDYCKLTNSYCDSGGCPNGYVRVDVLKDDSGEHYVCLKHPSDPNWVHYRWKTIELIYTSFPNLDTFKSP